MDLPKEVNKYLLNFEKDGYSLVGFYQQGSTVFGLADEFSDIDFITIWKGEYPKAVIREEYAKKLGFETHDFRDIPQVQKGLDAFIYKGKVVNIAHIKDTDFFNFYNDLENPNENYEEMFMRLEGFIKGAIVNDPSGSLKEYKSKIKVTPEIIDKFTLFIKDELEHDLKMLHITAKRSGVIYFLRYFVSIVNDLRILESLKQNNFPGSLKWFESVSPDSQLSPILSETQNKIDKEDLASKITKIAEDLGFRPSEKIKA